MCVPSTIVRACEAAGGVVCRCGAGVGVDDRPGGVGRSEGAEHVIVGEGACPCFWLEPTGQAALGLRRFTFGASSDGGADCPMKEKWGHDASVVLDDVRFGVVWSRSEDGYVSQEMPPAELVPSRDDPRWPATCESCGEPFPENATWQYYAADEYQRSDGGMVLARGSGLQQKEMGGALYDAQWLHGTAGRTFYDVRDRGDGIVLIAICPNGSPWVVDGKATGGGFWERTGDPRRPETLTVSPSIVAGDYHGFLQGGRFTAHIG